MFTFIRRGALAAAFTAIPLAWAGPPRAPADPLDPQAAVPAAVHRSSLTSYRGAGELRVGSWKDANEQVNRIGGWRAYAREAAAPVAPAAKASAPTAAGHKH
ncbi:hypothetical protein [Variovorax sp. YR752]|uniref:hypothetical protein n=1 Tax=Variovorax sp. YR752 TaxID=1884383 RepID=UPI0031383575